MEAYTTKPNLRILRLLGGYLWPKNQPKMAIRIVLALTVLVLGKLAAAWIPLFYKQALDVLSHPQQLVAIPVFLLVVYGCSRMISFGLVESREFFFARVEQRAVRTISLRVFTHLHSLGLAFHLDRHTGGVSRILERGVAAIETFLRFSTFHILPTFIEILLVIGTITYLYGPILTGICVISIGSYVWFTIVVTEFRAKYVRKMNEENTNSNSRAVDSLLNYETVKYFNNEDFEYQRYDKTRELYENAAVTNTFGLAFLNIGQGIIVSLSVIATLLFAANRLMANEITIGDFVLIHTYLLQLYQPLNILGFAYREIKRAMVEMEQMFDLLDKKPEVIDTLNATALKIKNPSIIFEHINFAYDPDRQILKDVSFTVPAGNKVAIVGTTGSGKSTITRLLFRFYDPQKGRILIDGQDIQHVTQESLRKAIGVVPQDTVLFNDTIYYNIQYGNPQATKEDVFHAAKMANLHTFINKLPQGYETLVGERGLKLSGGEKQRVAIARTILKKPAIFIFDEATSALDVHTEKEIQANLNDISKNQTTLVIAHRLSTIIDADEIIVLEDGEIVEKGTHTQLLKKKKLYAAMWARQSQLGEHKNA
jgi:ABC-type transport system involved in Fe-S cluster assembly fused permease/ATPase subunit